MNKKNGLIISSLALVAVAAIGVRSTAALFTDKDDATINVVSGKVDVSSTITNLKLYSAISEDKDLTDKTLETVDETKVTMLDENEQLYYSELKESSWTNGGTATFANSVLTIDKICAGDKVTFSYDVTNGSNVNIKYQFSLKCTSTEEDDLGLFNELVIKYGDADLSGKKDYATPWSLVTATDTLQGDTVSIMLPLGSGNSFQNSSCSFALEIKAVQANAHTVDPVTPVVYEIFKPKIVIADIAASEGWTDGQKISSDIYDSTNRICIRTASSYGYSYNADTQSVRNNDTLAGYSIKMNSDELEDYFIKDLQIEICSGNIYYISSFTEVTEGYFVASEGEFPTSADGWEQISIVSVEVTLCPFIHTNLSLNTSDFEEGPTVTDKFISTNERISYSLTNPSTTVVTLIRDPAPLGGYFESISCHLVKGQQIIINVDSQFAIKKVEFGILSNDYVTEYFAVSTGLVMHSTMNNRYISDSNVSGNFSTITFTVLEECDVSYISTDAQYILFKTK